MDLKCLWGSISPWGATGFAGRCGGEGAFLNLEKEEAGRWEEAGEVMGVRPSHEMLFQGRA